MLTLPTAAPSAGGVRLRPFERRDVPMLQDLSTDPYVVLAGGLAADATVDQAIAWAQGQNDRFGTGAGFSFCVADAVDDRALGQVGLWVSDAEHGRGTAGYLVAPAERGRGTATDALTAITALAWTVPVLHRMELYIEPWNAASVRAAQKAGYEREGLLRRRQVLGGRRVDMLIFAALRPD